MLLCPEGWPNEYLTGCAERRNRYVAVRIFYYQAKCKFMYHFCDVDHGIGANDDL